MNRYRKRLDISESAALAAMTVDLAMEPILQHVAAAYAIGFARTATGRHSAGLGPPWLPRAPARGTHCQPTGVFRCRRGDGTGRVCVVNSTERRISDLEASIRRYRYPDQMRAWLATLQDDNDLQVLEDVLTVTQSGGSLGTLPTTTQDRYAILEAAYARFQGVDR